ncbi:MAG: acyl carrier protein [Actinomycetales bacterium]
MSVAPTAPTTAQGVEDLVVELLADLLNEPAADLAARLRTDGPNMPVDSLDMFDILADFRKRTGLRLRVRELKRETLRSVKAFAEFVMRQEVKAT